MKSFRPDKMASVIRGIVSMMIADKIQDPRVSQFASVTRVEVSGDLQHAKVFISVMGSGADERSTLRGLTHARGHIQRAIASAITARNCPHVTFVADASLKKARKIIRIIDENVPPAPQPGADSELAPDADDDGEVANPSEGVY